MSPIACWPSSSQAMSYNHFFSIYFVLASFYFFLFFLFYFVHFCFYINSPVSFSHLNFIFHISDLLIMTNHIYMFFFFWLREPLSLSGSPGLESGDPVPQLTYSLRNSTCKWVILTLHVQNTHMYSYSHILNALQSNSQPKLQWLRENKQVTIEIISGSSKNGCLYTSLNDEIHKLLKSGGVCNCFKGRTQCK